VEIPYASKLFLQELETMCVASRLLTTQKLVAAVENGVCGGNLNRGVAEKNGKTE
jgi:hypothetical protein